MANEEDAKKTESQANTATGGTYAFSIGSIVVQLILSGSLYYVWGMIEGLQIVESFGLFYAKVPGNTSSFLKNTQSLSTFNIVDLGPLRESLMYFPESDAFSLKFLSEGYENIFVVSLLEAQFFYILVVWIVITLDMILLALSYKWPKIQNCREKWTKKHLYWNGLVRFFMEIYLCLTLFSLVNLMNMVWDT